MVRYFIFDYGIEGYVIHNAGFCNLNVTVISKFILFSDRVIGRRNISYTKVTKPNIYRVAIGEGEATSRSRDIREQIKFVFLTR
jgi:hypothetical protein